MKKLFFNLVFLCLYFISDAQFTISGKVVDAESKEPLQSASVFAQNTTRGTVTDKDGSFTLTLNKGGYELIITYTGYISKTINIESSSDRVLAIEMQKADNSLSEIVIRSSNEVPDGWEKYGVFFLQHFIGSTPFSDSCLLQNPQALKFYYFKKSDRLKVLASDPLIILNRSLGYSLRYELDSFVHYFQNDINTYRGRCLYTPLEGSVAENQIWIQNRREAYVGSRLHFLRAYYDSTVKQEGFTVDILSQTNSNKFNRLVNPYDTSYYYFNVSSGNAELYFPFKASITYTKKAPEKQYLLQYHLPLDVNVRISYVDLTDGIIIRPNGYFFDQKSWINQGYWSWKNLADQLPYDYELP